jgi:hypothetical protein
MKREHVMILSVGLEMFYLPFVKNVLLDDSLQPNNVITTKHIITIKKEDLATVSTENGWLNDTMIDFVSRWLLMDGSSVASQHCYIATTADFASLKHSINDTSYMSTRSVVARMAKREQLGKPWIVFPINKGNYHWCLVALLNPCNLNAPQEEKLSGYIYYDPTGLKARQHELDVLMQTGVLHFLVSCNFDYGNPRFSPTQNIMDIINDPAKFVRFSMSESDEMNQPDSYNCGMCIILCMIYIALVMSREYQEKDHFVAGQENALLLQERHFLCLYRKKQQQQQQNFTPELLRRAKKQLVCLVNRLKNFRDQQVPQENLREASLPEYASNNFITYAWQINKQQTLEYQPYKEVLDKRRFQFQCLFDRNPSMFKDVDVDEDDQVSSVMESVDSADDIVIELSEPSTEDLQMVGLTPPVSQISDVDMALGSMNKKDAVSIVTQESSKESEDIVFQPLGKPIGIGQDDAAQPFLSTNVHASLLPLVVRRPNPFEGFLKQLKSSKSQLSPVPLLSLPGPPETSRENESMELSIEPATQLNDHLINCGKRKKLHDIVMKEASDFLHRAPVAHKKMFAPLPDVSKKPAAKKRLLLLQLKKTS